MELTGGCLCEAVRYRTTDAPITARACWCRMSQGIGAGSGNGMYWRFCQTCGAHVLAMSERRLHFTAVRVGTLDDPEQVRPMATIWAAAAPSSAPIDPARRAPIVRDGIRAWMSADSPLASMESDATPLGCL